MIIPIAQQKEDVLDKANEIKNRLNKFRVKLMIQIKSGWKFSEQEMCILYVLKKNL